MNDLSYIKKRITELKKLNVVLILSLPSIHIWQKPKYISFVDQIPDIILELIDQIETITKAKDGNVKRQKDRVSRSSRKKEGVSR